MEELWKPVQNFETHYEVSTYGRVRTIARTVNSAIRHNGAVQRQSRILKLNLKRNGYLVVDLCVGSVHKTALVHRLAAIAFLDNPDGKPVVNHKNANKQDNRVENLEWVTVRENAQHASKNGLLWSSNSKPIVCVETGMVFESSYKAAEWLNANKYGYSKKVPGMGRNIRACCCGTRPVAYGFHWKDLA